MRWRDIADMTPMQQLSALGVNLSDKLYFRDVAEYEAWLTKRR